jgi:hypothetical protein
MDSKSLLSNRFSAQVKKFSVILSKELSKPCKSFIYDMLYGIQKAKDIKLKIMKEKIFVLAKRFFAIPVFFCYSMADGIYNLLKSYNTPINKKSKPPNEFQLFFNFH